MAGRLPRLFRLRAGYLTEVTSSRVLLTALACAVTVTGCQLEAGAPQHTSGPSIPGSVGHRDAPPLASVRGNRRNAIAWAPLSDPDDVTVEGSVPSSRAWSTSKALVVAAYLDAVAHGDPAKIPADTRASIDAALAQSDDPSINSIRHQIPNPRAAMTRVLRDVGDTTTRVPGAYEGTMQWSVREQVRFMAALANGRVVTPQASAFLLREMQPIGAQRWGLGTIGARAFKPGWMNARTESRQMGIVGDFAVAIITAGDGPVARVGDGDAAHAWQLNRLAKLLAKRLDEARCLRSRLFGWDARWCLGLGRAITRRRSRTPGRPTRARTHRW